MSENVIYLIFLVFFTNICAGENYNNFTLYRVIPVNKTHVDFFSRLKDFYDVHFWREPGVVNKAIDFIINPIDKPAFLRDATRNNIYLTTIIEDVQKAFDQQTVMNYIRRDMDSFNWHNYYRLKDIYQWLQDLSEIYPKELQIEKIGKSHENRDILAVRIVLNGCKSHRPKVIVEGGIHAREWIAPAFVTFMIYEIIHANDSTNRLIKEIANSYEWYFVPVLNVDGYEYTHTTDRLWRKNRNGHGVDLNRNFPHAFGTVGVSFNKRSNLYCGNKALSERETIAMANFVKSKSKLLEYYISFHSYGQYMILPYANSKEHLDNYDTVYLRCDNVAKKIRAKYKTKYVIGTAYDTVGYMSSGVSACWVKSTFKVPYVVTFELGDNGYDGFALSPTKILTICQETMDGLIELFYPENYLCKPIKLSHLISRGGIKISHKYIHIFILLTLVIL